MGFALVSVSLGIDRNVSNTKVSEPLLIFVKFSTGIRGLQRMNSTDFGDALVFHHSHQIDTGVKECDQLY